MLYLGDIRNEHLAPKSARNRRGGLRRPADRIGYERPGFAFLLNTPALLAVIALSAFPIVYSAYLSLHKYNLRRPRIFDFVGVANYTSILTSPDFWSALARTAIFTGLVVTDRLIEQTAAAFGRLDLLINNAGDQIVRKTVIDTPDELFDRHIAVNVWPTFAACRAAIRQFRAQGGGGNIINVTSVAARTGGGGGSTIYAGAKAFTSTFTRSLAKEVVGEGIRVNAVAPGVIATDMQDRVTTPEQLSAAVAQIPMKRVGEADECVGAFLYLASDKLSSYVTGQIIEVNGGILMP